MTIIVAVAHSAEGRAALAAAADEARRLDTPLVAVNLGLTPLDATALASDQQITVVDRVGRDDRDPVDAVLDEISDRHATRLVIGVKRRTPVGKLMLGSISQRLLLKSPIPVLAVKAAPEDDNDIEENGGD
ncbi:hypothetical protein GOPIP_031_04370 [Gordonia polyisoprenivorans NBRC 16320 = JCM 10675]|uniref:Universal stress protein n=1 Tax=Gordonia polyisoprenivorans TaxID=84595 RepID=A0A846WI66_9ACTN|nr:universal stress protein [Gordonia polyisoprenivorans]NKY00687.1 universal stress protein [Gordonia polyisoprenivorans]OZC33568.1 universal stress protein [Gordonia polyisoprenivorans]QUD82188.1 universal stress protein [Gordonia polyisoprenivorans]GAB22815.1 hypothetical protein GOPIP_031_04370 [Gordonia polyisoprenivorans NBRC 16320 = JCM 10675]